MAVHEQQLTPLLANTTFLKKISHSSHQLRIDNVRGSFLGHDIVRTYDGISNEPRNFERLFLIHREFTTDENLVRLIDATGNIVGTGKKFSATRDEITTLLKAPKTAASVSGTKEYRNIKQRLDSIVAARREAILKAAATSNINTRGNEIEQIISDAANQHGLEDMQFDLPDGITVLIDVKTKMLDLQSSPKGYNVDKVLAKLSSGNVTVAFYFVGVDRAARTIVTSLVSILDSYLLNATRIQFHWAGRNSRGVTQLTGEFSKVFAPGFSEHIDDAEAQAFLIRLLEL
jgi:hypothetical protein